MLGPLEVDNQSRCQETSEPRLKNFKFKCSKFTKEHVNIDTRKEMHEFKKYSTDLPLGPLEVDNKSTYTCDDITHAPTCNETPPPVTLTELRVSSGLQYDSCNCTEPINLPPVLIPIKDTAPVHVTSSKDNDVVQDVIHNRRCNRQIQLAQSERNDALRLAQLYRNKVEELVKEKKILNIPTKNN